MRRGSDGAVRCGFAIGDAVAPREHGGEAADGFRTDAPETGGRCVGLGNAGTTVGHIAEEVAIALIDVGEVALAHDAVHDSKVRRDAVGGVGCLGALALVTAGFVEKGHKARADRDRLSDGGVHLSDPRGVSCSAGLAALLPLGGDHSIEGFVERRHGDDEDRELSSVDVVTI